MTPAPRTRLSLVLGLVGAALGLFGLLWLACWFVSGFRFPVDGFGAWNGIAAAALIATGAAMVVHARPGRTLRQ